MKTTMINHKHLNKAIRGLRKITMQLIIASIVLAFDSCEKEEIFEPDQEVREVDEAVKATSKLVPNFPIDIQLINKKAAYDELRKNLTVSFKGSFYSAAQKTTNTRNAPQIWSSPNGSDWTLVRNYPFPVNAQEMVVYDSKIWVIGYSAISRRYQIYNSSDGYSWNLVTANSPFALRSDRSFVVFNNKLFVLEAGYAEPDQKIYSSSDGRNWTLENANAFPMRRYGTAVVFKDALYYMGGLDNGSTARNEIFRSTNGRDWSQVRAIRLLNSVAEDFPAKSHHAVVVHKNKVWLTGGGAIDADATQNNDIWVSEDMKNWEKYTGKIKFRGLSGATLLSHTSKILLLGGHYFVESAGGYERAVSSTTIWSSTPRRSVMVPVDRP